MGKMFDEILDMKNMRSENNGLDLNFHGYARTRKHDDQLPFYWIVNCGVITLF